MADVMPAIFFGHGNPVNAVTHNRCAEGWRAIRRADLQAQGHPDSLGSLVCAGNRRDYQRRAKNDS